MMDIGFSVMSLHADGRTLTVDVRHVRVEPCTFYVLELNCHPCVSSALLNRDQLEQIHTAIGQFLQDTDPQTELTAASMGG